MNRAPIDSSNVHSAAHDETGMEVQFHARGCSRTAKAKAGDPAPICNCQGGDVWHYPNVPAETYLRVISAPSFGAAFHDHVKSAKHAHGGLKYPGVKVEPKAATASVAL